MKYYFPGRGEHGANWGIPRRRRLRSNSVLAVPRFTRRAQLIVPARFGDRVIYRHIIRELLALDRRNPARRRRVDEKFGPLAHFARRFPSLQDARQFLEGEPSLPHSVAVIRNAIGQTATPRR